MAKAEIRRFLVERLLDLDPTLSDSLGSDMYTKVINPLMQRLGADPFAVNITEFITQRVREEFPELDMESAGSFLKDAVAKPLAIMLEPLQREIAHLKTQQSVLNYETLTSTELEAILANVLSSRITGDYARGTVRLFFSRPRAVFIDPNGIIFSTISGVNFIAEEATSHFPADMTPSGSLYYIDVEVQSQVAHVGANVPANSVRVVQGIEGVVRVTNPAPMSGGVTRETNQSYVERAERSLSERSLNTERGIETTLFNAYSDLVSVEVVGFGEPEMQRDLLTASVTFAAPYFVGSTIYTSGKASFQTVPPASPQGSLAYSPVTNKLRVSGGDSLAQATELKAASFVKLYDANSSFDDKLLSRVRKISSVQVVNADDLDFLLEDFTPIASGTAASTTVFTNEYSASGATGMLKVPGKSSAPKDANGDPVKYWVGAPLHFTDVVELPGDALPDLIEGRDFLVVMSSGTEYFVDCFPIRSRLSASKVRVHRADAYAVSKRRVLYTPEFTFTNDTSASAANEEIEVLAFGSTDYHNTTAQAALDGVATAGDVGINGGAKLSPAATGHLLEIKEDLVLRPEGFTSLGIKAGDYFSLAAFSALTGAAALGPYGNEAESEPPLPSWWGVCRVVEINPTIDGNSVGKHVARVIGLDTTELSDHSIFDYDAASGFNHAGVLGGAYALNWTAYRGELEMVLPDNAVVMSYDEFVFPPAFPKSLYAATNITGTSNAAVAYDNEFRYACKYDPSAAEDPGNAVPAFSPRANRQYNESGNPTRWFILRLDAPFYNHKLENGDLSLASSVTPRIVALSPRTNGTSVFPAHKWDTADDGIPAIGANERYACMFSLLPLVSDMHNFTWSAANPLGTLKFVDPTNNSLHINGFLAPTQYGDVDNQIVQFYDAAGIVAADDFTLTVSGMPGGIPTTDVTNLPVKTDPNKVHIGGLTDVYTKTRFNDESVLSSFGLRPASLLVDAANDIIFEGKDGAIGSAEQAGVPYFKSVFWSTTLAAQVGLDFNDAALFIENATEPALIGKVFRIVGLVTHGGMSGVQLASEAWATGMQDPVVGITFKVYSKVTTSLITGNFPVQQGTDLSVPVAGKVVNLANPLVFSEDPLLTPLFLKIESGANVGTYRIHSSTPVTLTLDTVVFGPESNIVYKILREQGRLDLPLVNVTSVNLSSEDEYTGEVIPRRDCVDVVAGSFVGLNNDPLTGTTGAINPNAVVAGMGLFTDVSVANWAALGVINYDVVKIANAKEEDTYYYVTGMSADKATLYLDRPVLLARSALSYTIGHPAVGKAKMYFLDPTYAKVGPETVFYNADKSLSFRPSPAERALMYQSEATVSDSTISIAPFGAAANTVTITSNTTDFRKAGITVGDVVTLLTKRIRSSAAVANPSELNVVSTSLTFTIGAENVLTTFVGTGTLSIQAVAQQLNSSFGTRANAAVIVDGANSYLQVTSRAVVTLAAGSPNALAALNLASGATNATGYVSGAVEVTALGYTPGATPVWTITALDSEKITGADTYTGEIFFQVDRTRHQHAFPADMVVDSSGLSSAEFTLTSRDPWVTESVASGEQFTASAYESLGYTLLVDNTNYSYSTYESLELACSSVVLPANAKNFLTGFPMPHANVSISYANSPTAASIQDYLLLEQSRVVCNNPLSRTFLPAYPRIVLSYTGTASAAAITARVQDYLETLYPNRTLEVFDVEAQIVNLGVDYLEQPLEILYIVHDVSRKVSVIRSKNALRLPKGYHITVDDTSVVVSTATGVTSATISSY